MADRVFKLKSLHGEMYVAKKDQSLGRMRDFSTRDRHSYHHRLKRKPDKLF